MKLSLLILILALAGTLCAQKIEKPRTGFSTVSNLRITALELSDSETSLSFEYKAAPGSWIFIPKGSCIQVVGSESKNYVLRAEGIPLDSAYHLDESGRVEYQLFFPAIDKTAARIDFFEDNEGGNWKIFDIRLKEESTTSPLAAVLQNIWFAADGSKQMQIALYDDVAVYQSQLWKIDEVTSEGPIEAVSLSNKKGKQTLYFESINEHQCRMGTDKQTLYELNDWPNDLPDQPKAGNDVYTAALLKSAEATYSGYIRDYTPRAGFTTGMVHVNNVLTGNQESYVLKIEESGYFSVSIPMCYPEEVFLSVPGMHRTVFLEPGKNTFQLLDAGSVYNGLLFQGEMAMVNNGLFELKDINYFDYNKVRENILDSTPEAYKATCVEIRDKELKALHEVKQSKFIAEKAFQVKQKNIECDYLERLLSYDMNYYSALRSKKGKDEQVSMDDVPSPDSSWYAFITPSAMNDPLLLLSSNYYFLVNRLKYAKFLRPSSTSLTPSLLAEFLDSKGIELTEDENNMLAEEKKAMDGKAMEKWKAFSAQYNKEHQAFAEKHKSLLEELNQQEDFVFWHDIEKAFADKGVELTGEELKMIGAAKAISGREEQLAQKSRKSNSEALHAFYQKYQTYSTEWHQQERLKARNAVLNQQFGIGRGLIVDVMYVQDQLGSVVEELTPLGEDQLELISSEVSTPFIAQYARACNDRTIEKIAELKAKSDYVVHQTPDVDSEQLFESMMEPFKGKVVYVDFWATWCGPCRSGMQRIKPLKESLDGRPIVFVYITNDSSPEGAWKNMVAEIGGEHYRLDRDEWNILSERFGVSGIPHYLLVDKEGKVARNNGMPSWNNDEMAQLFEIFINK
ncbi:TlpA family protein disulfide reductase [Roseimarinus sediminis]|uniref:TlpA family protein disulfide reductase n=1 Tax=Roseimarinus sediminis TaxID=1610899 RepID=UPI003D1B748C